MDSSDAQPSSRTTPELDVLVRLFYSKLEDLGQFEEVTAADMPDAARRLLSHDEHMTVALEAYHGCDLDVHVLRVMVTPTHYARHVRLSCHCTPKIVQYGIVRLSLMFLEDDVRREIQSEQIPLGRVLISHDVLRKVRLLSLWRITPSHTLRGLLGHDWPAPFYGRTALIYCNEVPAVELLEIVPPR
jgi:chorismate-pyruvate lyase